jgi:uncharacterized protein (UPF0333 family)
MQQKRGQAAMEFLMTYGWAILVVLAAIGALAYFGVLSPSNFLPGSCTIGQGFNCMESKVSSSADNVQIRVRNNIGGSLSNVTVTLNTTGTASCSGNNSFSDTGVANGGDIGGGLQTLCTGSTYADGDRFAADIIIDYTRSGESVSHRAVGTLRRSAEP